MIQTCSKLLLKRRFFLTYGNKALARKDLTTSISKVSGRGDCGTRTRKSSGRCGLARPFIILITISLLIRKFLCPSLSLSPFMVCAKQCRLPHLMHSAKKFWNKSRKMQASLPSRGLKTGGQVPPYKKPNQLISMINSRLDLTWSWDFNIFLFLIEVSAVHRVKVHHKGDKKHHLPYFKKNFHALYNM
jgi:hypothetical protein